MHGKVSLVNHSGRGIFNGITNPLRVTRYHSLVGDEKSLPNCLEISATSSDDNAIMAVQHKHRPIYGVQFHPEAILTQDGKKLLYNFLYRR
jgi:anthranilate synthase/aminodeoxychorismate synthase-like glutamine amidotransferase